MPRTNITASAGNGAYPVLPLAANSADLAMTASDIVNKNQTTFGTSPALLIVAQNTHASAPGDITIESALDALNRKGDITDYVLEAGDIAFFILQRNGWRQTDNNLYFDGSAATIKFGIVKL